MPDRIVDVITLDHGDRHRRRIVLNADGGTAFLLDLDQADVLEDGDAIRLESGWLVEVKAAPETLVEITTEDPLDLLTLAWHIGNRHVPAEITREAIYIAYDHVLVEMLRGLGATVEIVERPVPARARRLSSPRAWRALPPSRAWPWMMRPCNSRCA